MHTTLEEALALARALAQELAAVPGVRKVLCPPFPWLTDVSRLLVGTDIVLGAQNMHFEDRGGFTGEVSPVMLEGLCQYVILGHSERRVLFRETDWQVSQKVAAALKHGLGPILCVGETADQLSHGETGIVLASQLEEALKGVVVDGRLVAAYDPVWATMGMVTPPRPKDVNETCGFIRETLAELSSPQAAEEVGILYGGPLTPRSAAEFAAQPEIDGALVGGASLRAPDFVAIVRAFGRG